MGINDLLVKEKMEAEQGKESENPLVMMLVLLPFGVLLAAVFLAACIGLPF